MKSSKSRLCLPHAITRSFCPSSSIKFHRLAVCYLPNLFEKSLWVQLHKRTFDDVSSWWNIEPFIKTSSCWCFINIHNLELLINFGSKKQRPESDWISCHWMSYIYIVWHTSKCIVIDCTLLYHRKTIERELHIQWSVPGQRSKPGMPRSSMPVYLRLQTHVLHWRQYRLHQ